jgi:acetyl-CoA acetyltransferase
VLSGQTDLALAVGVEKLYDPAAPGRVLAEIGGGFDRFDEKRWIDEYRALAARAGVVVAGSGALDREDTYGVQASYHMRRYGTTREQIAIADAKNHVHVSLNPKAQYRFPMTKEALQSRGAEHEPDGRRSRLSNGWHRTEGYRRRRNPRRDVVLRNLPNGDAAVLPGWRRRALCRIRRDGPWRSLPVNTSGGLVSKGHPIAATGLSMIAEISRAIALRSRRPTGGRRQNRSLRKRQRGHWARRSGVRVTILEGPR